MHGRAVPPAGRELFDEFAEALAGWRWDAALLQEVPPWWPQALAGRLRADARSVLTSRNFALPLRRATATRWPDVIKSNGGGCNAILIRRRQVLAHRRRCLRRWPERRWLHGVLLDGGIWVGNLHLGGSLAECVRAGETMMEWASGDPAILGGDFNVRELALAGFEHLGGHDVDQVFARQLRANGPPEVLDRGPLSDHAPVLVSAASAT